MAALPNGPSSPNAEIFRAYDIRGVVGETLDGCAVYQVGRAFAAAAMAAGQRAAVVGGDGRKTTPALREALHRGLLEGGIDVMDVGRVPTPLVYYATKVLDTGTGVMITGSHNPPEYNGLKMMIGGAALTAERIQGLRERIERGDFSTGAGGLRRLDLVDRYVDRVVADVSLARRLKVVADCGNGVAGLVAPRLLTAIGCEVVPLYADVDGAFPNHHPDPADAANLQDLIDAVGLRGADLGLAFDGDGDRLGVVTESGSIIWPDRLMMLFARDVLRRKPGARIVFDVKCSRHLPASIRARGGEPIMWRTGHSHVKAKIQDSGAAFGGEFSGHLCFADRWYGFDDALYAAARLVEILAAERRPADEVFADFAVGVATPEIKIAAADETKFEIMAELCAALKKAANGGAVTDIDGIRVDYADGWGLARASNTGPALTLRFEADDDEALRRIQGAFDAALRKIDETLAFIGRR